MTVRFYDKTSGEQFIKKQTINHQGCVVIAGDLIIMEVQSHTEDTSYLIEVISVKDLAPGQFRTFEFQKNGVLNHGLVINYEGTFYGYVNLCPHAHIPLDAMSSNVFNADGSYLICRKHWALFEPHTGNCVSGPCPILPLSKLEVIIQNGIIYVAV